MTWLTAFGSTSRGTVREENQDWMLIGRTLKNSGEYEARFRVDDDYTCQWGWLAAVADGMGGHAGGSLAARIALETLERHFFSVPKQGGMDLAMETLREGVERANHLVMEAGMKPDYAGLGSTIAGVVICGGAFAPFHAGDSRVYRFRLGALRQLTRDDSVAALAEEVGYQAGTSRRAGLEHLITNGLGMRDFKPRVGVAMPLQPGDILVITSDGLHGALPVEAMEHILEQSLPLAERGRLLMAQALETSTDNATLILIEAGPPMEQLP
ncbi:MAG TPA: protein phosphatase 2C domain-containing protein [Candidatus Hydrogenedentes bacterium]|nr:serine/threonine-protein phosphatase [Candidatus Hydrogenedentota bacterium]HOJ68906.1 protein phosphatase 2C domain-containing protein [Candidatus Hydrogenedentota bacterium]HOK89522.1 protein phosphatase 2C domain-containing protein [Candidatus Hydrogenedentota bacterium]HOV61633.1 protein phosphatase 2C domain-containing protein [Candidatus Hydrogenedentota bacterium]